MCCHYGFSFLSFLNYCFMLLDIDAIKEWSRNCNLCSTIHYPKWLVCRLVALRFAWLYHSSSCCCSTINWFKTLMQFEPCCSVLADIYLIIPIYRTVKHACGIYLVLKWHSISMPCSKHMVCIWYACATHLVCLQHVRVPSAYQKEYAWLACGTHWAVCCWRYVISSWSDLLQEINLLNICHICSAFSCVCVCGSAQPVCLISATTQNCLSEKWLRIAWVKNDPESLSLALTPSIWVHHRAASASRAAAVGRGGRGVSAACGSPVAPRQQ